MFSSMLRTNIHEALKTFRPNDVVVRGLYGAEPPLGLLDAGVLLIAHSMGQVNFGPQSVRQGIDRLAARMPVEVQVFRVVSTEDVENPLDEVNDTTEGFIQWVRQGSGQLGRPDNEVFLPPEYISIHSGLYVPDEARRRRLAYSTLEFACETLIPYSEPEGFTGAAYNPTELFTGEQTPWNYPVDVDDQEGTIDTLDRDEQGRITAADGTRLH